MLETQQAVEKALKAVLLSKRVKFRFVHDIVELSKGLTSPPPPAKPAEPPPLLAEARWIPTSDVSRQRTPGVSPGVNANKYRSTVLVPRA